MPFITHLNGHIEFALNNCYYDFPVFEMPPAIRDAVLEVSKNFGLQTPVCAQAALAAVSLASQNFITVRCPPFDPAPVSLYLMTILKSSGGKSVAILRFLKPVTAFEEKLTDEYEAALQQYRAELKIWADDDRRLSKRYLKASEQDTLEKIRQERLQHENNRPLEPRKRTLRFEETSPQGLRDALADNSAIGIISPDGGPTLNGMTFSQPAALSGYWSGEDRAIGLVKGEKRPVKPCLTTLVMPQEERFVTFMKNRGDQAFGTGLLARFLVANPKVIEYPGQPTHPAVRDESMLNAFSERVSVILTQVACEPGDRQTIVISEDAMRYLEAFKNTIHDGLICADYAEDMKSFFRKIAQQATRIAALFHYFEGAKGEIPACTMKSAISLCEWYMAEFFRVFSPYAPSKKQKDEEAAGKLLEWLKDAYEMPARYPKLSQGQYSERQLRNFSSIRDKAILSDAINTLAFQEYIAVHNGPKGGRIIYYPNCASTWASNSSWHRNEPTGGYLFGGNRWAQQQQSPAMPLPVVPVHNYHAQVVDSSQNSIENDLVKPIETNESSKDEFQQFREQYALEALDAMSDPYKRDQKM